MCCLSEEEGKSISTGIVIADSVAIASVFPEEIEIPLPERLYIGSWRRIRKLCGYVDGETAAFSVDKSNGWVNGAKNFHGVLIEKSNPYSQVTGRIKNSVALQVVKGCRCVRLYSDGDLECQIILIRKYGEWASRNTGQHLRRLEAVAASKGIDITAIHRVFKASLRISEIGEGAQFLIADKEDVESVIGSETLLKPSKRLSELTEEQLIRDVTKDGAAILGKAGELGSVEAKFLATGGRLASMLDVTKLVPDAMAIVVSMDGQISVVDKGKVAIQL